MSKKKGMKLKVVGLYDGCFSSIGVCVCVCVCVLLLLLGGR